MKEGSRVMHTLIGRINPDDQIVGKGYPSFYIFIFNICINVYIIQISTDLTGLTTLPNLPSVGKDNNRKNMRRDNEQIKFTFAIQVSCS